jgi:hypothetical protein
VRLLSASIAIQAPLLLALLPVENLKSEFDMMMMDHTNWSGFAFFLDKDGKLFRSDVRMNGLQSGLSGSFELQLDNPSSKDLIGTARTRMFRRDPISPHRFALSWGSLRLPKSKEPIWSINGLGL